MGSILIVDDESLEVSPSVMVYAAEKNADILRKADQTKHHEIHVAHDVKEAEFLIRQRDIEKNSFDVIVTDMRMPIDTKTNPELDPCAGLRIIKRARTSDPFTRIIAITAYSDALLAYEAMSLGAMYFDKLWLDPTIFPTVVQVHIDEVIRRRSHFQELSAAMREMNKLQQQAGQNEASWWVAVQLVYNHKEVLDKMRAAKALVHLLPRNNERIKAEASIKTCIDDLESFFKTLSDGLPKQ